ncbi:hypothetical protein LIER_19095 [Lithospermum erythrorhizon]|uniref:Zinc-finger domain-containing protein n=1 Tax=Lithospermum erythrorhizon TaxID=34254 RepID=A0AAV3QGI3_LITER
MVRKRSRSCAETQQNAEEVEMVCGYERSREERIKENLERMQKLGILNLSLQVKSLKPSSKSTSRTHFPASPLPPPAPSRRSSRLQNATPVSYCEVKVPKKDKSLDFGDNLLRLEGSRPEVYTEEHEKLLGSTEQSWTLFVDGCGKDGKRIYDSINGKTCHQCRQKTLGHRTHCCKCNMVQGQFCGDCLYMRYGEHVLEAKQNPNWICPACRGICNCSLCRQAKGWPPTGSLYRKISALGYKSVAHYLIQTRREKAVSDDDIKREVPLSAKRALPFLETETASTDKETSESNYNPQELVVFNPEEAKTLKKTNEDIEEKAHDLVDALSNSTLISADKIEMVDKPEITFDPPEDCPGSPEPEIRGTKGNVEIRKENETDISVGKEPNNCVSMKISEDAASPKSGSTSVVTPILDEYKLQDEKNVHSDEPVTGAEEVNQTIVDNTNPPNGVSSPEANMNLELNSLNDDPKDASDIKEDETEKSPVSKKMHGRCAIEPVVDSIAGRLRQRRARIN